MDIKYDEVKGANQNETLQQCEPCMYTSQYPECRHRDAYGRCEYENCIWDEQETSLTTKKIWFNCIICNGLTSRSPQGKESHICESCRSRMKDAEQLPFTCRYCGKSQYTPSKWMFSKVCDECIDKLYSPNCKNYSNIGSHSFSNGGSLSNAPTYK